MRFVGRLGVSQMLSSALGLGLLVVALAAATASAQTLLHPFAARNLTGTDYVERQRLNGSELIINSYDIGRSFSFGATLKF